MTDYLRSDISVLLYFNHAPNLSLNKGLCACIVYLRNGRGEIIIPQPKIDTHFLKTRVWADQSVERLALFGNVNEQLVHCEIRNVNLGVIN